jgi:hypothetical protein
MGTPVGSAPAFRRHATRPATVLRAAFRRDEDGTGPELCAETFLEFGDGVLVAGRFLGGPVEEPFLHECFVRGGKVVLIREYPA